MDGLKLRERLKLHLELVFVVQIVNILPVLLQIILVGKFLVAVSTHIGFYPRMRAQMPLQFLLVKESVGTDVTRKFLDFDRYLRIANSMTLGQMYLVETLLFVGFITMPTSERLDHRVVPHVLLQFASADERFGTNVTNKLFVPSMSPHVLFVAGFQGKSSTAHVATVLPQARVRVND
jgi:hypothetical protein